MTDALERLKEENIPFLFCGYSSLDRYFRVRQSGPLYLATDSSIVSLAKAFDNLQFPGLPLEDAAVQVDHNRLVFRCVDSLAVPPSAPFTVLRLLYDPARNAFIDRLDMYPDLRAATLTRVSDSSPRWLGLCEAARLVSRYHYSAEASSLGWSRGDEIPPPSYQRDLLMGLLGSGAPTRDLPSWTRRASWRRRGRSSPQWPRSRTGKDFHPEQNLTDLPPAPLPVPSARFLPNPPAPLPIDSPAPPTFPMREAPTAPAVPLAMSPVPLPTPFPISSPPLPISLPNPPFFLASWWADFFESVESGSDLDLLTSGTEGTNRCEDEGYAENGFH